MNDSTVRVLMPLSLTPEMIKAVREHPTTSVSNNEEWYTRLGWLICAYDVLLENGRSPPSLPTMLSPIASWECSRCKVNRLMSPCPSPHGCPMVGVAAASPPPPSIEQGERL